MAGLGKRMKSYGHKSLIELTTGETILSRQLTILTRQYPKAEIICVLGFEADKIYRTLPPGIRTVENSFYEDTGPLHSLHLGLKASATPNVLIVYGDLIYEPNVFAGIPDNKSTLLVVDEAYSKEEVGVTYNNQAEHLGYSLPNFWGQIAYLTGKELDLFKIVAYNRGKSKFFGFEALNEVIDLGGVLDVMSVEGIIDIDSFKDLELVKGLKPA